VRRPSDPGAERQRDPVARPRRSTAAVAVGLTCAALASPEAIQAQPSPPGSAPPGGPVQQRAPLAAEIPPDIEPFQGRLITDIIFDGLERVPEQFVRNQLRTAAGQPLDWRTVQLDLRNLERLGEFRRVEAELLVGDELDVRVLYRVIEAPIVEDIEVVGNNRLTDQRIARAVGNVALITQVPIDDYRIGAAARAIEQLYRDEGFYQVEVTVDESELRESGAVIFRIREGERLRVTAIRFEGNASFPDRVLRSRVDTEIKGIFNDAPLDDAVLDRDVGELVAFYRDRGYLEVRASRRILPSPDGREAIVTFVIDEGPVYTLREVEVLPARNGDAELDVLSAEQVLGLLAIAPGDAFSVERVDASVERIRDGLRQMGYIDARVDRETFRNPDTRQADLRLRITEGRRFKTGLVLTTGHDTTKSKVIRREVDLLPDHDLDGTAIEETELRLRQTRIFRGPAPGYPGPRVVVQPEDPAHPGYRDVLVEVDETRTGSLGFGAAVGSDQGVTGSISLSERNFDIADTPDSLGELLAGRAFRGAGQSFAVSIAPGSEVSTYSVGLSEPALFESDYSLSGTAFLRNRVFTDFDEDRFGGRVSLGRRFGTRWSGSLNLRAESINIEDIEDDAAVDIFDVEGQSALTGLGIAMSRRTTDQIARPTRGTASRISIEQVGALGGDYNFTRLGAEHTVFLTIDEDYFGRETVLSLNTSASYIPQDNEAPVFERFFLGGRSFRGFDFRGIGPVGIRNDTGLPGDDQVGGDWAFFFGAQVEKPVVGDIVALVAFVDTGTVEEELGFDNYRVSVGTGVRLYVPQFGPVPIAFDFGFPLVEEDTDDRRIFSFFIDVPF